MTKLDELAPKHRIGFVNPAGPGDYAAYVFYRLVPGSVMMLHAALGLQEYTKDGVETAIANFMGCADELARGGAEIIVQAGIPIAAQLGRPRTLELLRQVEERFGVAAQSNFESVIAGMQHLGVKTLTVGSRWPDELNNAVKAYLAHAGIEVLAITSRGQWAKQAFGMSLEEGMAMAVELGREAVRLAPQADGVLLPGGAWISVHAIPMTEEASGKPTFTNLQSMTWQALRRLGTGLPIKGWGRLLESA